MLNIYDARAELPRHPTQKWGRRKVSDIEGVVFHQSLGNGSSATAAGVNAYHIGKNSHLKAGGAPRIAYYAFVEPDGRVVLCNDVEDITWSQGGQPCPHAGGRSNTNYLAVCFGGDFSGTGHRGGSPTEAQLQAARELWAKLSLDFDLDQSRLFGHSDFGKKACPGTKLRSFIDEIRYADLTLPRKVKDWQAGLVALGYSLGDSGPEVNGVDGDWGLKSQGALDAFCKKEGIRVAARDSDQAAVVLAMRRRDG